MESVLQSKKWSITNETNKGLTLDIQQIVGVPLAIQSTGRMYSKVINEQVWEDTKTCDPTLSQQENGKISDKYQCWCGVYVNTWYQ